MDCVRNKVGFICDMDGVIYHGKQILPGVGELISRPAGDCGVRF